MATSAQRARTRQKNRRKTGSGGRSTSTFWIAAVVLIVLVALAIVMTRPDDGGGSTATVSQFRDVTVQGEALPPFAAEAEDGAVGMQIPSFEAKTFAGDNVSVTADGHPKVVMFLAHWCPHCQADVRALQAWIEEGGSTDGVDLYAVSTWADPAKPNYPASEWLERESWSVTTAVDDKQSSLASAYGLSGTPMYVFVDDQNAVTYRYSGELPIDQFEEALATIR